MNFWMMWLVQAGLSILVGTAYRALTGPPTLRGGLAFMLAIGLGMSIPVLFRLASREGGNLER